MAPNRGNTVPAAGAGQARPLKPTLASNRTAKTPLAPRLAATTANSLPTPRLAATTANSLPTPRLAATAANVLPRATPPPRLAASANRLDGANNNLADTPTRVRPALPPPAQSEPNVHRNVVNEARPTLAPSRPKSFVNGKGRDTVVPSPAARVTRDTPSPMFFHANQVTTTTTTVDVPKRPVANKASSFLYANGEERPGSRESSHIQLSDTSVAQDARTPHLSVLQHPRDHASASPLSPPLSAISSKTPYFPSPITNSPSFRPPSPPKENLHLAYRKGVSSVVGRTTSPSPAPTLPNRSSYHAQRPTVAQTSAKNAHTKSQSLSSISVGTPESRRQPITIPESDTTSQPSTPAHTKAISIPNGEHAPSSDIASRTPTHLRTDSMPSPAPQVPDMAAEARRERKVLDLEISNSSLLAINKSLERELRKQKSELKRFRRLSRAGQFNVTATDTLVTDRLSTLTEDDDFDDLDVGGRPSSPFMSDPADDYSDEDDEHSTNSSSAAPLSPAAQAMKDEKQRADDEKRLRQDLDRHRELLLDTQRMNKSLQRCLTWTEDLIQQGKKALHYEVPSEVISLGGRILTDDDVEAADNDDAESSTQAGDEEPEKDDVLDVDALVAEVMGGYFETRGDSIENVQRPGSEQDSGIEIGSSLYTTPPRTEQHGVEFGKPTPLRNPLLPTPARDRGGTLSAHSSCLPGRGSRY